MQNFKKALLLRILRAGGAEALSMMKQRTQFC